MIHIGLLSPVGSQGLAEVGRDRTIVITNFLAGAILLLKNGCILSVSHEYVDTGLEN